KPIAVVLSAPGVLPVERIIIISVSNQIFSAYSSAKKFITIVGSHVSHNILKNGSGANGIERKRIGLRSSVADLFSAIFNSHIFKAPGIVIRVISAVIHVVSIFRKCFC